MIKHYVTFYSPGTFVHEETTLEVESWNVDGAIQMARTITERHNAKPFGFRFKTRERGDEDFDSRETQRSGMYYLGGTVLTLADVKARNDRKDEILIWNMECNGFSRVLENRNSWKITVPLHDEDTVLDYQPVNG